VNLRRRLISTAEHAAAPAWSTPRPGRPPPGSHFNAVRAGQHNLQFWWDTRTDPDMVRMLLYSANANGGTNRNRYKNAEMDKLIDDAAGTTDPARRKRLYTEIQMKVLREAVMVFFADPLNVFAYQKAKVMGPVLDWSATNVLLHNAWLKK
jgi:ABC-type transport system substrate-binding protein